MSTASPTTSVNSSSEISTRVLKALDGRIEPVKVTLGYRLAIMVVAALMVLLPVIYLALIALVGYGAYWHLVNNVGMLNANVKGKGMLMVFLAYLTPGIVGGILVAFMLKPLFARRRETGKPQTVRRDEEPLLFEFIDRLCDVVGSPRPKSILLDDNVNAAAALTSGAWNPFRHDLMLVIGLPLVAGMNLKQFAGILAHEFGHFSQGAGMRLGGIINSVNRWFAFVVFQRDEWDAQLERWSNETDIRFGWVIYLTRGCVWLTRKILHGLMIVGHAMSCRLSREMEFDADRHEARLSGSDTFAETCHCLPVLMGARNWAISDLSESYREGRLVDDFFSLISLRAGQIPDAARQELKDNQLKNKTGWFDTHPCDADRIASAQREHAPGLLQIDAPASILFEDFSSTCRAETLKFYRSQLDQDVPQKSLIPLETLVARQKAEEEERHAIERVLHGICHYYWTLPFPKTLEPASDSVEETVAQITRLRQRVIEHSATHLEEINKLHYNVLLGQEANLAEAFLKCGMTVGPQVFTLPMTNLEQVVQVRAQAMAAKEAAYKSLEPILGDLADRIIRPVRLLANPSVAAKIPDADKLWEECRWLISRNAELREYRKDLFEVHDAREVVRGFFNQLENNSENPTLIKGLLQAMSHGVSVLKSTQERLRAVEYPFDHVEEGITVSKYLIETVPAENHPAGVDGVLTYASEEGLKLGTRIIGRLCVIVETVEAALGLPLGEAPKSEETSTT